MIILIFPRFIYLTDYVTSNAPDFIISFVVTVTLLYNISLLKYRNNFSRKGRQEISSIDKTVACRSQWIVKYSYGFSSPLNLYPTPQTVIIYRGLSGCGSIFSLSFLMNEERLLASGALSYPHTFS